MRRVAVATFARGDLDLDGPVLMHELARAGVEAHWCAWDDDSVAWDSFDLVVLRSTWDYTNDLDAFLAWAKQVPRLVNPYEVVAYSSDKHYLADLAAHGIATIPSHFCDVGDEPDFPDGDVVVKPTVGAGSIDAERFSADEGALARAHVRALHGRGRDALIQPYVHSVDRRGERAVIYVDGAFSHAMTKGAMLNASAHDRDVVFRRAQMSLAYDGPDEFARREPGALALADEVLRVKGLSHLLYARVDLVEVGDAWAVMELELIEPSLFLTYYAPAAARLARAIARQAR